jgi:F-type H+-transporting ATPase subunit b
MNRRRIVLGTAVAGAVLIAAGSALAAGGGHGPVTDPHINWWHWDSHSPPIGWFFVNFVIFIALLVRLAGKPVNSAFAARADRIRDAVTKNERELEEAKAEHQNWKEKLANVELEGKKLVENAKADGKREKEKIVETAEEYAKRMREDTSTIIDQEAAAAQRDLQLEISHQALHRADSLLEDKITDDDRKRLFELAVKQLADGTGALEKTSAAGVSTPSGGAAS